MFRQVAWIALVLGSIFSIRLSAAEPKKIAFLVGVSDYADDTLANLNFADDDATGLAEALTAAGFEAEAIVQAEAGGANIRSRFATFLDRAESLASDDVVFVGFFGHGLQRTIDRDGERVVEAFFCPSDAVTSDIATLLPIGEIVRGLRDSSGSDRNLLVIDAGRDDPIDGERGIDAAAVRNLPAKVSVLFACSPAGQSFESGAVRHGILAHVLIDGLKGEAADRRGDVTWLTLADYAAREVPVQASRLLEDATIKQRPNLVGNFTAAPVLARAGTAAVRDPAGGAAPPPMPPPARVAVTVPAPTAKPTSPPARKPPPVEQPDEEFVNTVGMKLLPIPAGEFLMGSKPAEVTPTDKDELPEHRVRIARPFYIGQTEVTQKQWYEVMNTKPWQNNVLVKQADDYPAVFVSHNEAAAFCDRLTALDGNKYRLPTEAEWEYACRAGTTTRYSFGDDADAIDDYGWTSHATFGFDNHPRPVAKKKPNAWKLYDMHGNVYEWCRDWYEEAYYAQSPLQDPRGPDAGTLRVVRGGSVAASDAKYCRSANRYAQDPARSVDNIGFRVVCER